MVEPYSYVRIEAKRSAMEALAVSTKAAGYDTNHDTKPTPLSRSIYAVVRIGGPGRDRTDDLSHAIELTASNFNSLRGTDGHAKAGKGMDRNICCALIVPKRSKSISRVDHGEGSDQRAAAVSRIECGDRSVSEVAGLHPKLQSRLRDPIITLSSN